MLIHVHLRPTWAELTTCAFVVGLLLAAIAMSPGYSLDQTLIEGRDPTLSKVALKAVGSHPGSETISIVSGSVNGSWLALAYDLAASLDDGDSFRVLPVIGAGGGQNVHDVIYLSGIDLGITAMNVIAKLRRADVRGPSDNADIIGQVENADNTGDNGITGRSDKLGNINDKIVYITKLSNDEMHVLVRADSGITSLRQLDGKKVNLNSIGSATEIAAHDVFDRLGITPIGVNMDQADAYEKMKTGEIAATTQLSGKPAQAIAKLGANEGLRLLPVPYDSRLPEEYLPATLSSDDYPALIPAGEHIETIAVGTVMIAYNWPKSTERYRRLAGFVDRFFGKFSAFQQPPRYAAWREVNLAAKLPGWKRFPGAQAWLDSHRAPAPAFAPPPAFAPGTNK